jgi:hypothetical protein
VASFVPWEITVENEINHICLRNESVISPTQNKGFFKV